MNDTRSDLLSPVVLGIATRAGWIWPGSLPSILTIVNLMIFFSLATTNKPTLILYIAIFFLLQSRDAVNSYIRTNISSPLLLLLCLVVAVLNHFAFVVRNRRSASWQGPGQPYLIPCKTTYRRLFPKKHSFSYSYLTVGVPVDYKGSANGMIGVEEPPNLWLAGLIRFTKLSSQSWYTVHASDHLPRGHDGGNLRGKSDRYLLSEEVNPEDYAYAYLVTAAKFAGYSFNPVSVWYLYSQDKTVAALVLELNNTFDERRPYFLTRDVAKEFQLAAVDHRAQVRGVKVQDFHVSPFSSRNGHCSVYTGDPLGPDMHGLRGIDVTITLNSSKDHPKLVARLFSRGPATDPMLLTSYAKVSFLAQWFWYGFTALPRIVKEELVLLFHRGFRDWTKPAPLIGTLGRQVTREEQIFEMSFQRYLEYLVRQSKSDLSVKFYSAGMLAQDGKTFTSLSAIESESHATLEIRILAPTFYIRLVQGFNPIDVLLVECKEGGSIQISKPELLAELFTETVLDHRSSGFADRIFTSMAQSLRGRKGNLVGIGPSIADATQIQLSSDASGAMRNTRSLPIDAYILSHEPGRLKRQYRIAVIRQLIADRYLFSYIGIVDQVTNLARICVAWTFASFLKRVVNDTNS